MDKKHRFNSLKYVKFLKLVTSKSLFDQVLKVKYVIPSLRGPLLHDTGFRP